MFVPVSVPSGYFEKQCFEKKKSVLSNSVLLFAEPLYRAVFVFLQTGLIRNSFFLLCHAKSYPDTVKCRMVCVCIMIPTECTQLIQKVSSFSKRLTNRRNLLCGCSSDLLSMHQLLQNPVVIFTKTSSSSLNFWGSFLGQETFVLIDTPNGLTAADGPSGP